ncbi:hypothetical protein IQ255_28920 [Pleurocapsales cyanobacterium LEGE 10410]|nr:hypothetical protein [Pleurocapsales cyanobacterium LEGE 10410]
MSKLSLFALSLAMLAVSAVNTHAKDANLKIDSNQSSIDYLSQRLLRRTTTELRRDSESFRALTVGQMSEDEEEMLENPGDIVDPDTVDQQPVYDSETGEEVIENYSDVIDTDDIDQQPVYDSEVGEEPIEDPADEADLDEIDQIQMAD